LASAETVAAHDGQHQKAQMEKTIADIARRIEMSLLVRERPCR
jgi:hypothetical protein